jgi:hypothetical protein
MKKTVMFVLLSLGLVFVLPVRSLGWGTSGHRLTARIASQYLSPAAQVQILELLRTDVRNNKGYYQQHCPVVLTLSGKKNPSAAEKQQFLKEGLTCIAPWPDPPVKDQRNYTSNWHFVDIPVVGATGKNSTRYSYSAARDCVMDAERGDCAILAIQRLQAVLGNPKMPDVKGHEYGEELSSRAEALKFIVHIIGDLHQPLHCVTDKKSKDAVSNLKDLGDLGGNLKIVTWFGETKTPYGLMNLHSVWDDGFINQTFKVENLNEEQFFERLLQTIPANTSSEFAVMQDGDIYKWSEQSYDLAVVNAYGKLPPIDQDYEYEDKNGKKHKGGYRLDNAYYQANKSIIEQQLKTGGVRLAKMLNSILVK